MAGQAESLDGTQGLGDQAARDNGALRGGLQHPLSLSSHAGLEGARLRLKGSRARPAAHKEPAPSGTRRREELEGRRRAVGPGLCLPEGTTG